MPLSVLTALLARYGLTLHVQADGEPIKGSFWGDQEAGIVGRNVYVRGDTPVHSLLHETGHTVCMTEQRRQRLDRDAGGDDLEEAAVCYLQIILASEIGDVGSEQLMLDMDTWGYSFRLGSASSWFRQDAADACQWLIDKKLLSPANKPIFNLRP